MSTQDMLMQTIAISHMRLYGQRQMLGLKASGFRGFVNRRIRAHRAQRATASRLGSWALRFRDCRALRLIRFRIQKIERLSG